MTAWETVHNDIWCDTSPVGSIGAVYPFVLTAENPSEKKKKKKVLNSTFIKAALAYTSL